MELSGLRVRYGGLIVADAALSEGTRIRRPGGRPSGSRARGFLGGLMKISCSIWMDGWITERVLRQPAENQQGERADLRVRDVVMRCRS